MMEAEIPSLRVVVFGVTGHIGASIAFELMARGHEVTGYSQSGTASPELPFGAELRAGDVTDGQFVADAVRGHDAVVSAIGPRHDSDADHLFVAAAHGLIAGLRLAGVRRLIVVGGAGSLEVAPGVQAVDTPDFPEADRAAALAQRHALDVYRTVDDLDWTYVSPADHIGPGAHTRDYQLGHNQMLFDDDGVSRISYADYADGVVDCIEQDGHLRERITLAD